MGGERRVPGQQSEWQPPCFLMHFLSWQLPPARGPHSLVAVLMASTTQQSSSSPGICLALGRGEQTGWDQETPRNLKGWAKAKFGIHTRDCRQHLLALGARRERGPGSGKR